MRDFYKVLGIAATADDRRIKSAFRRRAKAFHPDLNPGSKRAEERFKELTQAYEVLRSAHARACYDAFRVRRRSEARRRFAQSAALMAASFVMTMGSAYAVMAVHGGAMPIREGWQLAVSSLRATATTASAIAEDTDRTARATPVEKRVAVMEIAKVPRAPPAASGGDAAVEWSSTTSVHRHEPDRPAGAPTTLAAVAKSRTLAAAERHGGGSTSGASWRWPWQWPEADGSYMGLGATSR